MRSGTSNNKQSSKTFSTRSKPRFDRMRFKTLVHYICWTCEEPRRLSVRRLNQVLWYTDRNEYFFAGKPLTGATYYKQHMGPATRALPPVLAELQRDGAIARREASDTLQDPLFFALKKPMLHLFTSDQISAVEAVARNIVFDLPTEIPNRAAHDRIAGVAQIGETIPYSTVFAGRPAEILRRDISWGVREATRAEEEEDADAATGAETGRRPDDALDALFWYLTRDPSAGISLPATETSWFLYKQLGAPDVGVPDVLILYRFDLEELVAGAIKVVPTDTDNDEDD